MQQILTLMTEVPIPTILGLFGWKGRKRGG